MHEIMAEKTNLQARTISPAIISSFSVTGENADWKALPDDCKYVDAYAFMQRCLPGSPSDGKNAVEHLADFFQQGKASMITDHILNQFPGRQIIALSTFMPEISANEARSADTLNATKALQLLIDVVRQLKGQGHPVQTIEIVGGSRIQGVFQTKDNSINYSAMRLTGSHSLKRLIERLRPIAAYAMNASPVFLSVELEPGPLFVLSNAHTAKRFCRMIEQSKDAALSNSVGLNLDIPHWDFLAGTPPEWLLADENESVRHRITHVHVSDHHVGHFSCTAPGSLNPMEKFARWMSALKQLSQEKRPGNFPQFSGFVSCEMEACREKEMLVDSFNSINHFLL
jgi:sugar phosphate isomerase/epimerase